MGRDGHVPCAPPFEGMRGGASPARRVTGRTIRCSALLEGDSNPASRPGLCANDPPRTGTPASNTLFHTPSSEPWQAGEGTRADRAPAAFTKPSVGLLPPPREAPRGAPLDGSLSSRGTRSVGPPPKPSGQSATLVGAVAAEGSGPSVARSRESQPNKSNPLFRAPLTPALSRRRRQPPEAESGDDCAPNRVQRG